MSVTQQKPIPGRNGETIEQRRPLAAHDTLVRLARLSLPNARRVYHACEPFVQAWLLPGSRC